MAEFREYDTARYLDTDEAIAAYLNAILEEDEPGLIESALKDVARARAMHGLAIKSACEAQAVGSPESGSQPFDSVRRTLEALGMKLQIAVA